MLNGTLVLKSGVYRTLQRSIPISNITTLDAHQNWLYRLLGIMKVSIQTSDSNEDADARLVISSKKYEAFTSYIRQKSNLIREEELTGNTTTISIKGIFMLSISSNLFWLGIPFVLTALQYINKFTSQTSDELDLTIEGTFETFDELLHLFSSNIGQFLLDLITVIGGCALLSWLLSVVLIMVRYHGWNVSRHENTIAINYGLFEKRKIQILVTKIQSVRIKEQPLSRWFGYASIWIDCVGYGGDFKTKILIPSLQKNELRPILHRLLPEFQIAEPKGEKRKRRAIIYSMLYPFGYLLLGMAVASMFVPELWFIVLLVAAIMLYRAFITSRSKWGIVNNQLVIVKAGLTTTSIFVLRKAIEALIVTENRMQRQLGLRTLEVEIDEPSRTREYVIRGIEPNDSGEIMSWYKNGSQPTKLSL